jgi:hypothetical protein
VLQAGEKQLRTGIPGNWYWRRPRSSRDHTANAAEGDEQWPVWTLIHDRSSVNFIDTFSKRTAFWDHSYVLLYKWESAYTHRSIQYSHKRKNQNRIYVSLISVLKLCCS